MTAPKGAATKDVSGPAAPVGGVAVPRWPTEATRAADGDGWVATTEQARHRMGEDQAVVWNACRSAMISAYNRSLATGAAS